MAKALTDQERARIVELIQSGKGCVETSKIVGRSPDTVSRIANAIGHRFGETNLSRAHASRSAYCAERRAAIAERLVEEVDLLLDELHGEYLVFNFGGKDNTYEEHLLSEPPTEVKRALVQSVRDAMRTVIEIDRHDAKTDEGKAKGLLERLFDGLAAAADV